MEFVFGEVGLNLRPMSLRNATPSHTVAAHWGSPHTGTQRGAVPGRRETHRGGSALFCVCYVWTVEVQRT